MENNLGISISTNEAEIFNRLIKENETFKNEVSFEIEASCLTIVANAKIAAPKDFGILAGGVSYRKLSQLEFEIISPSQYTAFMEFGTKSSVSIPPGWEEFAAKFKNITIETGGLTLAKAIEEWAKRQGLSKAIGIQIYLKILRKGVNPHPFIIPAYLAEMKQLSKRISNLLNR